MTAKERDCQNVLDGGVEGHEEILHLFWGA